MVKNLQRVPLDDISMVKSLQRVPLNVSIRWRYLHHDAGKTYSEISKLRSY